MGAYSDDLHTAYVSEATPPPLDSRRGRSWFQRGTHGLRSLLEARWSGSPRTHYIGEWHFHPANVPSPSHQDIQEMRSVARNPNYQCTTPILMVLYPNGHGGWATAAYVFVCNDRRVETVPLANALGQ